MVNEIPLEPESSSRGVLDLSARQWRDAGEGSDAPRSENSVERHLVAPTGAVTTFEVNALHEDRRPGPSRRHRLEEQAHAHNQQLEEIGAFIQNNRLPPPPPSKIGPHASPQQNDTTKLLNSELRALGSELVKDWSEKWKKSFMNIEFRKQTNQSAIYFAEDAHDHKVVLKVLKVKHKRKSDTVEPTSITTYKYAGREIENMQRLRDVPYILPLLGAFDPNDGRNTVVLVLPRMTGSLANLVNDMKTAKEKFTLRQFRRLARILLKTTSRLHAAGIWHRDLKPENILYEVVKDEVLPRISDFGLSCILITELENEKKDEEKKTQNLGTKSYSAPEVYLKRVNKETYTEKRDEWALAATLFCLLAQEPLICLPVNKSVTREVLVKCLIECIGTKAVADNLSLFESREKEILKYFLDKVRKERGGNCCDFNERFEKIPFDTSFDLGAHEQLKDVLWKMLHMDYDKRIKANDALHHPFFTMGDRDLEEDPLLKADYQISHSASVYDTDSQNHEDLLFKAVAKISL